MIGSSRELDIVRWPFSGTRGGKGLFPSLLACIVTTGRAGVNPVDLEGLPSKYREHQSQGKGGAP